MHKGIHRRFGPTILALASLLLWSACADPEDDALPRTESGDEECSDGPCVETRVSGPPLAELEGFALILPGTFTMGSPEGEPGRVAQREEEVSITLTRPFHLQETPVTQGQYEALMGSNPSEFSGCGADCPVERVSWEDAIRYANTLSRSEGLAACYDDAGNVTGAAIIYDCEGYRLPTEFEWEYAARASTTTATWKGEIGEDECDPVLETIAWYSCNSDTGEGRRTTQPVGLKEANPWGLYDMLGNVWEWTHTWLAPTPERTVDPLGPDTGSFRVIRGGSWSLRAQSIRAAMRGTLDPVDRISGLGFRVARTAR